MRCDEVREGLSKHVRQCCFPPIADVTRRQFERS